MSCEKPKKAVPAPLREQMVDSLDMELASQVLDAVKRANSGVVKALVKDATEQRIPNWRELLKHQSSVFCAEVPGAAIAGGGSGGRSAKNRARG